jgi:hypothetical protein
VSGSPKDFGALQSDDVAQIYAGLVALVDAIDALKAAVVSVQEDVRRILATQTGER